ncbi:MAG: hypothetical protein IJU95_04360 [Treponema sp.]|nr:hypothetical protein [Treponema sp.]
MENSVTKFCKGIRTRHIALTEDGELLLSTYSANMPQLRVSPDGGITVWSEKDGFTDIKCRVAIKAKNGDYYVGFTKGLSVLRHGEDGFITLDKADGIKNDYIMWLYEDEKEQLWVGTNGGGVYVLKNLEVIKHYGTDEGLAGNVIFKIGKIDGHIWISTGTGISKFDEDTDTFVSFNSRMGLGTDSVFQLLVDYTDTAWMTTNKGIFSASFAEMIEVAEGKKNRVSVKYYGNSDGLVTNGVTSVSLGCIDSLGRAFFPLVDGFAIYDPVKSGRNIVAPPVEVQGYTIDSESHDWHGDKIILPPGTRRFSVKYTGLSFISSESIRFKSMLQGFDTDYSDWESSRTATYTNLKHGEYSLKIMSQNSDGVSGEPVVIPIEKKPYLWELWWFRISIELLLLATIALVILLRIRRMRRYQVELEQKVDSRTHELKQEKERSEQLLLNILPKEVAAELTAHPDRTIAQHFPSATVLFTDIVGFTKMSGVMSAEKVVSMLNRLFTKFDERAQREGIEKIKTIGDAYMAAAGLSEDSQNGDAVRMLRFALGLLEDVKEFNENWEVGLQIRVGVNTGELVAGVIGKSKFIYDIWGDTVNVASRMESTGEPMKIHVSEATHAQAADAFDWGDSVEVEVKGKGLMKTYFL